MFSLEDEVAVVTGAGSGIGAAIARLFSSRGARVAAVDRDEGAVEAVAAAIRDAGGESRGYLCDVSHPEDVDALFSELRSAYSCLDILVNNAGIAHVGTIEQTTPEDLDRVYRVNVAGVYLCSKAAIPIMVNQGSGVILNMGSIAGLVGITERFAYSMSKGAVVAMTRSIALDYVKRGIRCNCICPARIHTPFVDGFVAAHYPGQEAEKLRELSEYQPMGRMGTPEEVASLALYLCSEEASFITGQAYAIDGGVLMA